MVKKKKLLLEFSANEFSTKKMPPLFDEISKRFATDYSLALKINLETQVKILASKPLIFLFLKFPKKEKQMIFNKVFNKIVDNDKTLNLLLKEARIGDLMIKQLSPQS